MSNTSSVNSSIKPNTTTESRMSGEFLSAADHMPTAIEQMQMYNFSGPPMQQTQQSQT